MTYRPIITNVDRLWALMQTPDWMPLPPTAAWWDLIINEIERFERHYNGQLAPYAEWSTRWRTLWWPNVRPEKHFRDMVPREFQPFFRAGSDEFARAMDIGTIHERRVWQRFGVAQFKPDDQRLKNITSGTSAD